MKQLYLYVQVNFLMCVFKFFLKFGDFLKLFSQGFKVNSSLEETKNILRFLQPLACVSHFELITIEDETDDIVHMFRQFLIHSSVHAVQFSPEMHKSRMLNNGRREVADL